MLKLDPVLLAYAGAERIALMARKALAPKPDLLVWQWADLKRKLN